VNRTARLLFSKVEKAFNFKDYTIASQAKEIAELRARLEEAKPKRRKKVHPNPNTIFAGIEDIVRAKKQQGEVVDVDSSDLDSSSGHESDSGSSDCIVVARKERK